MKLTSLQGGSSGHRAICIDSHADGAVFSGLCSLNESICAGASWSCEHGRFLGLQPPRIRRCARGCRYGDCGRLYGVSTQVLTSVPSCRRTSAVRNRTQIRSLRGKTTSKAVHAPRIPCIRMCAAALVVCGSAEALLGPGERKRAMAWQLILSFRVPNLQASRTTHAVCAARHLHMHIRMRAYVHELYLFGLGAEDAGEAQSIQLYVVVME